MTGHFRLNWVARDHLDNANGAANPETGIPPSHSRRTVQILATALALSILWSIYSFTSDWRLLVNFAATGGPNGKGLTAWPAFDPKSAVIMEIGDNIGPGPIAEQTRIAFFSRYFSRSDAAAR